MPIHDVGYRPWDGKRTSQFSRWSIISLTGIRLAAKSRWVKRILFVAWLPVMYWGIGFFFLEKAIDSTATAPKVSPPSIVVGESDGPAPDSEEAIAQALLARELLNEKIATARGIVGQLSSKIAKGAIESQEVNGQQAKEQFQQDLAALQETQQQLKLLMSQVVEETQDQQIRNAIGRSLRNRFSAFPHSAELAESMESGDTARIRNDIWRWLLMVFFRYPQSIIILFLIGTIAPSLISRDLRSRAFLLYFSRPIGKLEYIFGKLCIPAAFIVAVTTLPALALYCFAVMMSPNISVIFSTWDIPFRIVGATFALVIPTASIALMLSSLTHESRFASFSWFAIWVLGHGAWLAIFMATAMKMGSQGNRDFQPSDVLENEVVKNWSSLSLYNCLGDAQELIFGFSSFSDAWRGILTLTLITVFSLFILYRRVSAPIRV